ncbi:MAG: transporter substrate-binding domain-containing protein [candidate division NC10 bacterium]|nr:transporter substrate-binding domain-containing protein [candidate division NC10 bacterium]
MRLMRGNARPWFYGAIFLMALSLIVSLGLPALAADTLDEVKARGKLIAGVKADFPPFGFIDEKGQNTGFDIDIAREFARYLFGDPNKVELVAVTSANRIPNLVGRKIDIILASMTILPERAEVIDFSDPYFYSGHLLMVRKGSPIKSYQDLAGKKVITLQGSTGDKYIKELVPTAERITFTKNSECLLALKDGRGVAFVQDDVLLLNMVKNEPTLEVVGFPPFKPAPYGLGVRKGNPKFLAWVNDALKKMKKEGSYDKLYTKWFGEVAGKLAKP